MGVARFEPEPAERSKRQEKRMSSRAERKRQAREERLARERQTREKERRTRRLRLLGASILAAAAVVAVLVALSGGGDDERGGGLAKGERLTGTGEAVELFEGIPQRGAALGDPDAPLRMVEFVDLQCPFCAQYSADVLPTLVERYVRDGSLRIELLPLTFIGDDSVEAGGAAAAAAAQDRMWQFVDLFYRNQGAENSGYVTPQFLRQLARGAGVAPRPVVEAAESQRGGPLLARAERDAQRYGIDSTPSFLLARDDGPLRPLAVTELTTEAFTEPLDRALRER
jgi:hypothetical protein